MKRFLLLFAVLFAFARLSAQTNAPVRLALISETDPAATAVDILTAQFSGNQKIQLLERDQIAKVYREQGLSAANTDYLKLGQILGADGLLLLQTTTEGTNQFLNVRLVAVKPGVVLVAEKFAWPVKDPTGWSAIFAEHLAVFLPKLTVLIKDAIPISVVNLRSAVNSGEAWETERQLKLLTIQRLSREPQLFVLERQKMQLLTEEKELKLDESAFWNGSYLLEGVVDQNGYSQNTVTINGRLTPPKGGAPIIIFEVSGSRTNLTEVVNQLAMKVNEALKVNSTVKEWNAADEAQQYFDEAKWALKWRALSEAQAAADSAWALGKRDLECATIGIKAYLSELSGKVNIFHCSASSGYPVVFDLHGKPVHPRPTDAQVQWWLKQMISLYPLSKVGRHIERPALRGFVFAYTDKLPDPENINQAEHLLELYLKYSCDHQGMESKAGAVMNDWDNQEWLDLGADTLTAASMVLRDFNFFPKLGKQFADKLAELRASARSLDRFNSQKQAVYDSFFIDNHAISPNEPLKATDQQSDKYLNIFKCEAKWGCFWQETPEDCVAFYRKLMSSPVFYSIHEDLWFRSLECPRLVVWNDTDQKRLGQVWDDFNKEMNESTNTLIRMEAKAMELQDAVGDKMIAIAATNLLETLSESRCLLMTNYNINWDMGNLIRATVGIPQIRYKDDPITVSPEIEALRQYCADFSAKLGTKDVECQKCLADQQNAQANAQAFEKQKQYLKDNKRVNDDPNEFILMFLFGFKDYSKTQALEIQPLLAAYKTNLTGTWDQARAIQVGEVEANVNRILNTPAPSPQPPTQLQAPKPAIVEKMPVVPPISNNAPKTPVSEKMPEITTNVLAIDKFLAIPGEDIIHLNSSERMDYLQVTSTAHHWFEGRLLLDYDYHADIQELDEKGKREGYRTVGSPAIAILNPLTERWDVVACPDVDVVAQNKFYHRTLLLRNDLFNCDGGQIRKYDFINQQWQVLKISDGNNYELFAINGHFYAASRDMIFEIMEGGTSSRILASARRNPPASTLDREDLGIPTLFEGPNHSLRVCTSSKIFTWTGNDWHEDSSAPPTSSQPEIFEDGLLFRQAGSLNASYQNDVIFRQANGSYGSLARQDEISSLAIDTNVANLCLEGDRGDWRKFSRPGMKPAPSPKSFWEMPANLLPWLPIALRQSDLYILEDQFAVHTIVNERHQVLQEAVSEKNGYNAALLCFIHDLPLPQKLFLKFDSPDAKTPTWMFPTTNLLLLGMEKSRDLMPGLTGPMSESGIGHKPGVWIMPLSQIDSAIVVRKQIQLAKMAQENKQAAATAEQNRRDLEQRHKDLLAKYDQNHNGIIDADEREAALDDSAFIESELDTIDINHNGWLDAEELACFDANKNKILEPKEQAGIETAQHLLAERLLKKFDANGDGLLDRSEFNDLAQSSIDPNARPMPGMQRPFPDGNHDGYVDLGELETFLKQQTRGGLRSRGMPRAMIFNQMRMDANQPVDPRQMFKAEVESYWQNPSAVANQPPFNNRIPQGATQ